MKMNSLTYTEKVMYSLRELYESYGYTQFKMNKFEEYDLYVKNKSFLLSDHIIAFTDTDGKLMALKPDVTLSIVKGTADSESGVRKVYYNENVYRVPKGGFSFKEIMQSGLECIGELDMYAITQVLTLAAKSLLEISEDFVLDISDLGIISAIVDSMNIDMSGKDRLLEAIGEKNIHTISAICREYSADEDKTETLKALVAMHGECSEMLEILKGSEMYSAACEFAEMIDVLKESFGKKIRIDFSVVDDMRYYNGIVFKGFVNGIPTSVLSGGRYDTLMERMGKRSGAIGFAVYLDMLCGFEDECDELDADAFVLYTDETPLSFVARTVNGLADSGKRVQSGKSIPAGSKFGEIVEI